MSNVNFRLTSVKSILQAAVNRLETIGWCKHRSSKTNSKGQVIAYCASGAINSVSRNNEYAYRAIDTLEKLTRTHSIITLNDRKSTRKSNIVAKFNTALAKL